MFGMDAQFNLISYAVLSTKFESDKNIALSFLPLVEHVLLNIHERAIKTTEVIDSFEEMFGYKLPYAIIGELINLLAKKGKVEKLKNESIEIYKEKLMDYDLKDEYELRLRGLVADVDIFTKKRGKTYDRSTIVKFILRFIVANVIEFNSFITYNSDLESIAESDMEIQEDLVEFLVEERKNNTENYKFLKDIYYGVVLASLITNSKDDEQREIEQYANPYNIENVLLDSNFVFRLLDLQTELEHKVSLDTYNMLRQKGCKFWICNETIKQIADTLRNYSECHSETRNKVLEAYGDTKFTGLGAAILRRNLTPSKIELIIGKLNKDIEKLEISIFDEFEIKEEDFDMAEKESLYQTKQDSSPQSISHDLKLIYIVRKKRPSAIFQMNQAKWWVLTDDNKLTKWNCKFSSRNMVQECITEAQIATVMWLNEPKQIDTDSFFTTVLALRNRNLVNNDEYIKISKIIEAQKNKYGTDENAVEKLTLVFSKQMLRIEDLLEEDEDKIDDIFLKKMDEAAIYIEEVEDLKKRAVELENDKLQTAVTYEKKIAVVEREKEHVKSILSQAIIENVEHLKSLQSMKEKNIKYIENNIEKMLKKSENQITICKLIDLFVFLCILYLGLGKIMSNLEEWYSKHELLAEIIKWVVSSILIGIGISVKNIPHLTNKLLIKIHLQNNYQHTIEESKNQIKNLRDEIGDIMSQIEEKIKLK